MVEEPTLAVLSFDDAMFRADSRFEQGILFPVAVCIPIKKRMSQVAHTVGHSMSHRLWQLVASLWITNVNFQTDPVSAMVLNDARD